MKLNRYQPFSRFMSVVATFAIATVMSLSLAACADDTDIQNEFEEDTTMLETPMMPDTAVFDTTMSDTLFGDTTGMGM